MENESFSEIQIGIQHWILKTHSYLHPREFYHIEFDYDLNNPLKLGLQKRKMQQQGSNIKQYDLSDNFQIERHNIETKYQNKLGKVGPFLALKK
jgi:hypothetical protein